MCVMSSSEKKRHVALPLNLCVLHRTCKHDSMTCTPCSDKNTHPAHRLRIVCTWGCAFNPRVDSWVTPHTSDSKPPGYSCLSPWRPGLPAWRGRAHGSWQKGSWQERQAGLSFISGCPEVVIQVTGQDFIMPCSLTADMHLSPAVARGGVFIITHNCRTHLLEAGPSHMRACVNAQFSYTPNTTVGHNTPALNWNFRQSCIFCQISYNKRNVSR